MLQVGSYHNLSEATLRKIEPWANQLAAKKAAGVEIGPERVNEELTEAQILLRQVGRTVFSATLQGSIDSLIPMSHDPNAPIMPPPPPMTQTEIDAANQRMAENHTRVMARMESIWRQLAILNGDTLIDLGKPQNVASRYEAMFADRCGIHVQPVC